MLRACHALEHYRAQCARVDAMLDYDAMASLWRLLAPGMVAFPMEKAPGYRCHGLNNQLPDFDASLLLAMIRWLDPRRIVEIGSGWSSAAIFDTRDRMTAPRLQGLATIDPDQSRILALDSPPMAHRIAAPVQSLGLAPYAELRRAMCFSSTARTC